MFETAELGRKVSKKAYAEAVGPLRMRLLDLQNQLRTEPWFSVVVVVAGVDGAGKGETVQRLHAWMDPRYLSTHAFGLASEEERERPPPFRFWRVLPPKGRIATLFGSWYTMPILRRVYGETDDADLDSALVRVNAFEKALVDDGTLLVKSWFHLSREAQGRRLQELSQDPRQSWRITDLDWKHFELYDDFVACSERALRATSTGQAPWNVIEGVDVAYRELTFGRLLADAIERRLAEARAAPPRKPKPLKAPRKRRHAQPTILSTLDLELSVPRSEYTERFDELQARLNQISRDAAQVGVSSLLVFEGWDAAGKGGAIRRVTSALDPRSYQVVPIAAPSDEEAARHYLWRFWRVLPRAGKLAIFDRSWYGRVLVERVEGLARPEEWRRAYNEIDEFEQDICGHGWGLAKFWLHIGKDEQLRRFEERAKTPYKRFKLTDEDYRNRKKWDLYEEAVNEMVERTSTSTAPWTLVEANDKRFARLKVLETVCDTWQSAIDRRTRP